MNAQRAKRILAACQVENNGMRTLRECAERAGIGYDLAQRARAVWERHGLEVTKHIRQGCPSVNVGDRVRWKVNSVTYAYGRITRIREVGNGRAKCHIAPEDTRSRARVVYAERLERVIPS